MIGYMIVQGSVACWLTNVSNLGSEFDLKNPSVQSKKSAMSKLLDYFVPCLRERAAPSLYSPITDSLFVHSYAQHATWMVGGVDEWIY